MWRVFACCLAFMACADRLPAFAKIEDMRVLAIQANPPEILLDEPTSFAVSFQALVVDPQYQPIDYQWQFCPVESGWACKDYEKLRNKAKAETQALLDSIHFEAPFLLSGTAMPHSTKIPSDSSDWKNQYATWPYVLPELALQVPGELFTYHWRANYMGLGLGAWPSVVLDLRNSTQSLTAYKRMVLGINDIRALASELADRYGIILCKEGETPDTAPGCLQVENRPPNQNPHFKVLKIAYGTEVTDNFQELEIMPAVSGAGYLVAGLIELEPKSAVRILPEFESDNAKRYPVILTDLQSNEYQIEYREEELYVSWFSTHGRFQERRTWAKKTKTLDTVFTAPAEVPEQNNGRITIWLVAQDNRGGSAWMSVEIWVRP